MTTSPDQTPCGEPPAPQSPKTVELGSLQPLDMMSGGAREAAQPQRRSARLRRLYAFFALTVTLTIVGGAALGLVLIGQMEGEISVRAFEDVIRSWGHWGVLASIGLMVLHSFVPFPAELLALANGMLYGPFWGSVITWVGAMLGAFLAFGLSRAFGRPFVETMLARRHWQRLDDWTGAHAAQMVFLARFLPVISFNLVNYAAGLTRISWWTFAWTTGLGILPVTISMAVLGDQAGNMPWHWWLGLLAAVSLGWLVIQRWLHHRHAKSAVPVPTASPDQREEGGS